MRQLITQEAIQANRRGIEPQVRRILGRPSDALIVDNADWLLPLNYIEFLRDIGRHFSVNRMLGAEAYKLRLEKGLSFIEFNYQLLQAYDFLVLNEKYDCALQIGGDDQWGNIVAGIDLIRRVSQKEVFGLTFPLLTTASGAKMGKTAAGAVWLDAALTTPVRLLPVLRERRRPRRDPLLKLLTFIPMDEIARLRRAAGRGAARGQAGAGARRDRRGPRRGRGRRSAPRRQRGVRRRRRLGRVGADLRGHRPDGASRSSTCSPHRAWRASKSAARRLVEQGGVRVGDRKVTSIDEIVRAEDVGEGTLLHAGKKNLRRIVFVTRTAGT